MAKDKSTQNPNVKSVSVYTPIDNRHKKRKVKTKGSTSYEQDLDVLREKMRKSCDKGTCNWS